MIKFDFAILKQAQFDAYRSLTAKREGLLAQIRELDAAIQEAEVRYKVYNELELAEKAHTEPVIVPSNFYTTPQSEESNENKEVAA